MPPSDQRGFTLVEAVVATLILTVGLVSLAEMMAITLRMQTLGRNQTQAVRMAQDKLDQLMSLNFDTAAAVQVSTSNSLASNVTSYFDVPEAGYTRRWYVVAAPADPGVPAVDRPRQVTVQVIHDLEAGRTPTELISIIRRW